MIYSKANINDEQQNSWGRISESKEDIAALFRVILLLA